MVRMKQFAKVVGAFAMWGLSSVASAITIGLADGPVAFTVSGPSGGYLVTASGTLDITSLSANSLTLQVVLNNASTLGNGDPIADPSDVRLASWGFGAGPSATAVSFADAVDGAMTSATLASIPSLGQIEVCVWSGNNCSGGGNQGLLAGASDEFSLTLAGTWDPESSVVFDPLGVKFQGRGGATVASSINQQVSAAQNRYRRGRACRTHSTGDAAFRNRIRWPLPRSDC
jgi:hypothetical protein